MPRKKKSKSSALRRKFLNARMNFDGNEDNYQIAQFRNGQNFSELDIRTVIQLEFSWDIDLTLVYRNELGFSRFFNRQFKTTRVKFNGLAGLTSEYMTLAGLEMPEGYVFHENRWAARIIG